MALSGEFCIGLLTMSPDDSTSFKLLRLFVHLHHDKFLIENNNQFFAQNIAGSGRGFCRVFEKKIQAKIDTKDT